MSNYHRDVVSDRENQDARVVKAKVPISRQLSRRPALDELSNRLNGVRDVAKKLPEQIGDGKKKALFKEPLVVKQKAPEQTAKAYSTQQIEAIIDPDVATRNDPQLVVEYVNDIYEYLRELEVRFPIHETFLEGHPTTPKIRAILVNWLVQAHENFKLCLESLHLCISITDRYLQENRTVGRENLQLVGTAALMVACKYEEIFLPDLTDYVYICDNAFSKRQLLRMEMNLLTTLRFNLGRPQSIHFLRRYSKIARVQMEYHTLSKYILELGLLDHSMCHVRPSVQAAAACCLSLSILNEVNCPSKVWTPTLVHYTSYRYSDIKQTVIKFAKILIDAKTSKHQAVPTKYASPAFSKISRNAKLTGPLVKKLAQNPLKS